MPCPDVTARTANPLLLFLSGRYWGKSRCLTIICLAATIKPWAPRAGLNTPSIPYFPHIAFPDAFSILPVALLSPQSLS
jgi:hypothetical protein